MRRMELVRDRALLAWLQDRAPQDGEVAGFNAGGWDAAIWILNALYETDELPGGVSHDDVHRIERAAGVVPPVIVGDADLEEVLADATVVGSTLGRSAWPGPGWERLTWRELGKRLDMDPFASEVPPSGLSFPYSSWPANVAPPAEGSLDREQFVKLIDHLAVFTPDGHEGACVAFYAMAATGDFDEQTIYVGQLGELNDLYENEELPGSPSNVWPVDRSWFV